MTNENPATLATPAHEVAQRLFRAAHDLLNHANAVRQILEQGMPDVANDEDKDDDDEPIQMPSTLRVYAAVQAAAAYWPIAEEAFREIETAMTDTAVQIEKAQRLVSESRC